MSASKQKGTKAETALVRYLAKWWPHVERRNSAGANRDRGDVAGIVGVVISVKDCVRVELAAWWDELTTQVANDKAATGAVWFKRRGKTNPDQWYVLLDGGTYVNLLLDAGYGHTVAENNERNFPHQSLPPTEEALMDGVYGGPGVA